MAFIYKKIKQHKGIVYYLSQDRVNSRFSNIIAYDKEKNREQVVAVNTHKTKGITYMRELPDEVKESIEGAING